MGERVMAKQPEDRRTTDLFDDPLQAETFIQQSAAYLDIADADHPGPRVSFGQSGVPTAHERVRRFRARRKLFPASANTVCDLCGRKHNGECRGRK
jgi:hypothetical protein